MDGCMSPFTLDFSNETDTLGPASDLHEGLIEFVVDGGFKAKWHTDLTIRCQGREFFVHKIILGAQSQYFRKACDPNSPFQV